MERVPISHIEVLAAALGAKAFTHVEMAEALRRARRLVYVSRRGSPPPDPHCDYALMEEFRATLKRAGYVAKNGFFGVDDVEAEWRKLPKVVEWRAYHDACAKFEEEG